jgi:hypothetical protein
LGSYWKKDNSLEKNKNELSAAKLTTARRQFQWLSKGNQAKAASTTVYQEEYKVALQPGIHGLIV